MYNNNKDVLNEDNKHIEKTCDRQLKLKYKELKIKGFERFIIKLFLYIFIYIKSINYR